MYACVRVCVAARTLTYAATKLLKRTSSDASRFRLGIHTDLAYRLRPTATQRVSSFFISIYRNSSFSIGSLSISRSGNRKIISDLLLTGFQWESRRRRLTFDETSIKGSRDLREKSWKFITARGKKKNRGGEFGTYREDIRGNFRRNCSEVEWKARRADAAEYASRTHESCEWRGAEVPRQ